MFLYAKNMQPDLKAVELHRAQIHSQEHRAALDANHTAQLEADWVQSYLCFKLSTLRAQLKAFLDSDTKDLVLTNLSRQFLTSLAKESFQSLEHPELKWLAENKFVLLKYLEATVTSKQSGAWDVASSHFAIFMMLLSKQPVPKALLSTVELNCG